jgi:hypothetical protein
MALDVSPDNTVPEFESQFATSLTAWENRLVWILNMFTQINRGTSDQAREKILSDVRDSLQSFRVELITAQRAPLAVKDLLKARTAEAKLRGAVLAAWPPATLAREMLYLGAAVFGSGGVAYALEGYPGLGFRVLPSIALWGFGGLIVLEGLRRLRTHESRKWRYFESRLRIPP